MSAYSRILSAKLFGVAGFYLSVWYEYSVVSMKPCSFSLNVSRTLPPSCCAVHSSDFCYGCFLLLAVLVSVMKA